MKLHATNAHFIKLFLCDKLLDSVWASHQRFASDATMLLDLTADSLCTHPGCGLWMTLNMLCTSNEKVLDLSHQTWGMLSILAAFEVYCLKWIPDCILSLLCIHFCFVFFFWIANTNNWDSADHPDWSWLLSSYAVIKMTLPLHMIYITCTWIILKVSNHLNITWEIYNRATDYNPQNAYVPCIIQGCLPIPHHYPWHSFG